MFGTEGFKIPHILSLYISPEAKIPLVPSMSYLVGYKCSAQLGDEITRPGYEVTQLNTLDICL